MNLTGTEFFQVTGVLSTGSPSGETEQVSLAQILALTGGGPVRKIYIGQYDSALPTDSGIQWDSSTAGAKTEYVGPGVMNGQILEIFDGEGTANQYPVTLIGATSPIFLTSPSDFLTSNSGTYLVTSQPSSLVTIGGNSTLTLSDNFFSIVLKWDGISNWIIVSYYNGSKTVMPVNYLLSDNGQILTDDLGNPLLAD